MNIVIVEDSDLVREQLLRIIAQEPQLNVVGTASEEQEAIQLILAEEPDAVLLDLALAPGSGVRVLEKIREAGSTTRVLVFSNHIGKALREACALLGISGFYDKNSQVRECIEHLVGMLAPASDHPQRAIEVTQWQDAPEREVFDDLLHMACLAIGAPAAILRLNGNPDGACAAAVGIIDTQMVASILTATETLCDSEIAEVPDLAGDGRFAQQQWMIDGRPIRHYVGIPLILADGERVGGLCLLDTRPGRIDDGRRHALKAVSRSLRNEMELLKRIKELKKENRLRRAAEEEAQYLATHDSLTQLPNRVTLTDRLNQMIRQSQRQQRPFAVLFIDLDKFKPINDRHGHHVGDRTLEIAAERLQKSLRASDTAARLGGDEFVVLLSEFSSQDDVRRLAHKIMAALAQPFEAGTLKLQVSASIGIAIYPDHGESREALLQHADQAMYRAKKLNGQPQFSLYESARVAPASEQALASRGASAKEVMTAGSGRGRAPQ